MVGNTKSICITTTEEDKGSSTQTKPESPVRENSYGNHGYQLSVDFCLCFMSHMRFPHNRIYIGVCVEVFASNINTQRNETKQVRMPSHVDSLPLSRNDGFYCFMGHVTLLPQKMTPVSRTRDIKQMLEKQK